VHVTERLSQNCWKSARLLVGKCELWDGLRSAASVCDGVLIASSSSSSPSLSVSLSVSLSRTGALLKATDQEATQTLTVTQMVSLCENARQVRTEREARGKRERERERICNAVLRKIAVFRLHRIRLDELPSQVGYPHCLLLGFV